MPKWVKYMSAALVILLFGIPAILLGLLIHFWFFLLLLGLIFVPAILLRPAVEDSRR
jgi:hypothetical protein